VAGSTREHEAVVDAVFFGIEQVGAVSAVSYLWSERLWEIGKSLPFATKTEMNLIRLLVIATGGRRWA
jgi:hypothetical protein